MKRNLIVTIQVSFETDLPANELDQRVIDLVRKELPLVPDATPVGNYLVTITDGPKFNFPRSNIDDFAVDRRRTMEREVRDEEVFDDFENHEE